MKFAFINPRIPPAAMNFAFAMDLVGARFSHVPLGLATVAGLTPAGARVEIIDETVGQDPCRTDADVVALTGIYCQRERVLELAETFRAEGRHVVIGGPIAQDCEHECATVADTLFIGEAEDTWPAFVRDVSAQRAAARYEPSAFSDMSSSPVPRFDLLDMSLYTSGCVQATRGCPYQCEFCDVPTKFGSRPRSKPIARVVREVEAQMALGVDSIFFVDDHFAANRRYAKELLCALANVVRRSRGQIYFYTQVTLNVARDEELLELFHRANFRRFFVGIESSRPEQLAAISKQQNLEIDAREAIRRIQSYNISVWAGLIVGLDGDDASMAVREAEFVRDTAIQPTLIGLLQAMPGAPLFSRAVREGRLTPLQGIVGSAAHGSLERQPQSNYVPSGMSERDALEAFATLVRDVFEPAAFGERLLEARRRSTRPWPPVWQAVSRRNVDIVLRVLKYYLLDADRASRAMFLRTMAGALTSGLGGIDEVVYHLVIYKHLRRFYTEAAARAEEADEDAT